MIWEKKKSSEKEPEVKLKNAFSSADVYTIAIVKSILDDAKIPYIAKNEQLQNLFGIGNIGGAFNAISGAVEILVKEEDYDLAIELIKEIK